ncbi:MAG: threonylcarbamoyl-AMP synthase [Acidimicrobiia bacterium]|nr:threonylcarbamoyl-AMP synthase [Acidimicrobiia bacterium]
MAESLADTQVLEPTDAGIAQAVEVLSRGGLLGLPTETVYGLAADAEDDRAVRKIFEAKGRPADQPLIVHVLPAWANRYAARWSSTAAVLAGAFWPGPFTMVVPKSEIVPQSVTGGLPSVGLRSPDHPVAVEVLRRFGRGVAAPSANRYGHVSPTTVRHVLDDLDGRIDAVLDAGSSEVGVESTIVELDENGSIRLLRRGAITVEQIVAVTEVPVVDCTSGPVRAPGMVLTHYAPAAPVEILTDAELQDRLTALDSSVLVVSCGPVAHRRSVVFEDDRAFAAGLYDALRRGDDQEVSLVIVAPPTRGELAPAIMDRLTRAAHRG